MEVREALADAERRLADARKHAELIPELERQVEGLKSYLQFHSQRSLKLPDPPDNNGPEDAEADTDWSSLTRPEAIVRALSGSKGSLSPAQLAEKLRAEGRDTDNSHNVGIALSRMKKRGVVRSKGYGRWTLARQLPPHQRGQGNLHALEGGGL